MEEERWKIRTLINIAAILQLKILQFQSLSVYRKISFTMKYNFKMQKYFYGLFFIMFCNQSAFQTLRINFNHSAI